MLRNHPWLTQDAINFLQDLTSKTQDLKILEFGSGASTVWFAQKTKNLISIEHDPEWHNLVQEKLKECQDCNAVDHRLIETDYYKICDEFENEYFDLILVDAKYRMKCLEYSIRILKKGGIMMLDNAERKSYKKAYKILKDWKLTITQQDTPDQYGFHQPGWQTNYWIKP